MTDMSPIKPKLQSRGPIRPERPAPLVELRRLRKQGWSVNSLARRFSITPDVVRTILKESNP